MEILRLVIDRSDVNKYNELYFMDHPRAKKPPIKAPQHPSINEYTRLSIHAANGLKQKWKDFILWVLDQRGLLNKNIQRCNITYTTYFKINRRRDPDNVSPKYIFDGFVEGGLLADDNFDCIETLSIKGRIDKENPRMEFEFHILGEKE